MVRQIWAQSKRMPHASHFPFTRKRDAVRIPRNVLISFFNQSKPDWAATCWVGVPGEERGGGELFVYLAPNMYDLMCEAGEVATFLPSKAKVTM